MDMHDAQTLNTWVANGPLGASRDGKTVTLLVDRRLAHKIHKLRAEVGKPIIAGPRPFGAGGIS